MTRTLAQEVAAYLAVRTGAPGTVRAEQVALERYIESVGGGDLPPPHPPDLVRFRHSLRGAGAGARTIAHATNAVERLYRWLGEQGRLPGDSPYLEARAGAVVREAVRIERYPRPDFAICTLAEAVEAWLRWNRIERANRLQPKTAETYGRALRYWRAHLDAAGTDWRDAGRTDVRAFVRERRGRISRRSIAPEVAAVRLFYVWAQAEGAPLRAAPGNQIARLRWKQPPRRPAPFVK